ncbi:hypothetical protein QW71_36270, partial [Paenibacillus sp. IHB B 3415]|uniref:hypothetical protein n=1 Tax=Paenibacillus sp. IHB B 3415 TaxID=867080 RepID=UPI000575B2F0
KVYDEHLWSEWSSVGWIKINSMMLRTIEQLNCSVELTHSTVKVSQPTTVKLSVYGNVYSDDATNLDFLNGIVKVKLSGYMLSSTGPSGKFGDVELSDSGTTEIDVQFHDGIAEIPLTLTVPGTQVLSIEIVDLENSARSVEIEVLPTELNDALLIHIPNFDEAPMQLLFYRRDYLFRWLI